MLMSSGSKQNTIRGSSIYPLAYFKADILKYCNIHGAHAVLSNELISLVLNWGRQSCMFIPVTSYASTADCLDLVQYIQPSYGVEVGRLNKETLSRVPQ